MNRDPFAPLGVPRSQSEYALDASLNKDAPASSAHRPEIKIAASEDRYGEIEPPSAHRAWIPIPPFTVRAQRYNDAAQAVSELDAGVSFTVPWVNFRKYWRGCP